MSTTVEGVVRIYPPMEQGITQSTGQPWYKQLMVIETYGQYPKKVAVSFMGEKINQLQQFPAGTPVKVHVNPESREYNSKWFTDLNGWKVEHGSATQHPGAPTQPAAAPMAPAAPAAPVQQPQQPQYHVGQVVNGFQLQANGQWLPVQQAAPAPAPAPAPQFQAAPQQQVFQPAPAPQASAPVFNLGQPDQQFSPQTNYGADQDFFRTDVNDVPF